MDEQLCPTCLIETTYEQTCNITKKRVRRGWAADCADARNNRLLVVDRPAILLALPAVWEHPQ